MPAVIRRPQLFVEVGRVGRVRPQVAIHANLAIAIQVVEQHELRGQGVMIRSDFLAEDGETRSPSPADMSPKI